MIPFGRVSRKKRTKPTGRSVWRRYFSAAGGILYTLSHRRRNKTSPIVADMARQMVDGSEIAWMLSMPKSLPADSMAVLNADPSQIPRCPTFAKTVSNRPATGLPVMLSAVSEKIA